MLLVVLALPLFANAEERMFRLRCPTLEQPRRVSKVVQFGAIHALVGIPIGVALALSVGGAYFMDGVPAGVRGHPQQSRGNARVDARAHTGVQTRLIIVSVAIAVVRRRHRLTTGRR